jgi:hypothetical protein
MSVAVAHESLLPALEKIPRKRKEVEFAIKQSMSRISTFSKVHSRTSLEII